MTKQDKDRYLLTVGPDARSNSCVNFSLFFDGYAPGYKAGADHLVEVAVSTHELDTLVYPIVFLYRHWIELRLKEIVEKGSMLLGKPQRAKPIHCLADVWIQARSVLQEIWPETDERDLVPVNKCVAELNEIDPKSTAFRYPRTKDGRSTIPEDIRHINLRVLQERLGEIEPTLEGATCGIDHMLGEME
jgi:hypothetical protein